MYVGLSRNSICSPSVRAFLSRRHSCRESIDKDLRTVPFPKAIPFLCVPRPVELKGSGERKPYSEENLNYDETADTAEMRTLTP